MQTLNYCLVTQNLASIIEDTIHDADRFPDVSNISGEVVFTPNIANGKAYQLVDVYGKTYTVPVSRIRAEIINGKITHEYETGIYLFAAGPGSNPDKITYTVEYRNLRSGELSFSLSPLKFEAIPGGEVDLTMATPVVGATPAGVIRGPSGTSLESIEVDGTDLIFTTVNDAGSFLMTRIPTDQMVEAEAREAVRLAAEGVQEINDANLTASETFKNQAKTHADRAATSETNAKSSETKAKSSETNAKSSESNAKSSESNAKTSETKAKTSETKAKTSETNAAAHEQAASTAAADAASAMESTSGAADSIATSVSEAAGHADRAVTSESNAETFASRAETFSSRAKTSETNAKTSETNAKTSETRAKTSETNAKTSETNAAAHEQAAEAAAAASSASGVSTTLASGDISRVFQTDSPSNTKNMLELDHYGTGYGLDVQNMPGSNSGIAVHNYTDEEAIVVDNCDNETALVISNTINTGITPNNIAKGDFLSVAPWDSNYRKRWCLSLTNDLTWRNDTAHPISFQRVDDVTPNLRPQDDIAFQVKNASGAVTAKVFSSGAISTTGNITTGGSFAAKGVASKRHIVMNAASGTTQMTSTVSDDGTSYQNQPREIRVRKPVLLSFFWEGDGSIDLAMWNHKGDTLTTYTTLPAGGQQHTMLRLEPPSGSNATLVPSKLNTTVGTLHVYVEQTD